jgi:hypothetical protein
MSIVHEWTNQPTHFFLSSDFRRNLSRTPPVSSSVKRREGVIRAGELAARRLERKAVWLEEGITWLMYEREEADLIS